MAGGQPKRLVRRGSLAPYSLSTANAVPTSGVPTEEERASTGLPGPRWPKGLTASRAAKLANSTSIFATALLLHGIQGVAVFAGRLRLAVVWLYSLLGEGTLSSEMPRKASSNAEFLGGDEGIRTPDPLRAKPVRELSTNAKVSKSATDERARDVGLSSSCRVDPMESRAVLGSSRRMRRVLGRLAVIRL